MRKALLLLIITLAISIVVFSAVRTPRTSAIFNRSNDLIFSVNDNFGGRTGDTELDGDIVFNTGPILAPVERFRINSDGNVGLGTSVPAGIFHVVSDSTPNNTVLNSIVFGRSAKDSVGGNGIGGQFLFQAENNAGSMVNAASFGGMLAYAADGAEQGVLLFNTGVAGSMAERMRIDETGRILLAQSPAGTATERLYNIGGSLFWNGANLSSGTSKWSPEVGNNIYRQYGNVGVGITSPKESLDVSGNIKMNAYGIIKAGLGGIETDTGWVGTPNRQAGLFVSPNGSIYLGQPSTIPYPEVPIHITAGYAGARTWPAGGGRTTGNWHPANDNFVFEDNVALILNLLSGGTVAGFGFSKPSSVLDGYFRYGLSNSEIRMFDGGIASFYQGGGGTLAQNFGLGGVPSANTRLTVHGDLYVSGKITAVGGVDPPYMLYDANTRTKIVEMVEDEVPDDKQSGAVLFFNAETQGMEVYLPNDGDFYSIPMTKINVAKKVIRKGKQKKATERRNNKTILNIERVEDLPGGV